MNSNISICVGLWLAEGDNKTKREITFTNNCFRLVEFFHNTLTQLFKHKNGRVYSYGKKTSIRERINSCVNKEYYDNRARKPYYIYRIASVEKIKIWKKIVKHVKKNKKLRIYLLQGFFAEEGNIKTGSHKNRVLRIAQKRRKRYLERIFGQLHLTWKFRQRERAYVFGNRNMWHIFAKNKIADVHPDKRRIFWNAYNSYKQTHYKRGFLKKAIFKALERKKTNKDLSIKFNRSQARIYDILKELRLEGKVEYVWIGKKCLWRKKI